MNNYVKTKAYAAFNESGILKPWTFERRAVGDYVQELQLIHQL